MTFKMKGRTEAFLDDVHQLKKHKTDQKNKSCSNGDYGTSDYEKCPSSESATDDNKPNLNNSASDKNEHRSSGSTNEESKPHSRNALNDENNCPFINSTCSENEGHLSNRVNDESECHKLDIIIDESECYRDEKEPNYHQNGFNFIDTEPYFFTEAGNSKETLFDDAAEEAKESQCASSVIGDGAEQKIDPFPSSNQDAIDMHEITLAKIDNGACKDIDFIPNVNIYDRNKSQLSGAALNEYWRARNIGVSSPAQENDCMQILEDDDDNNDDQNDENTNNNDNGAFDAHNFSLFENDNDTSIKKEGQDNLKSDKTDVFQHYHCQVCQKHFQSKDSVERHFCEEKTDYSCSRCENSYALPDKLREHIRLFHGGTSFCKVKKNLVCDSCEKSFTRHQSLKVHIEKVHDHLKPVYCHLCGSIYTKMQNLKKHIHLKHPSQSLDRKAEHKKSEESELKKSVASEFKISCELCQRLFYNRYSLDLHIYEAHQNELHSCNSCQRMFFSPSTLKLHVRVAHENTGPFLCDLCGRTITCEAKLISHVKSNKCGEAFANKHNLTFLLDFPCDLCEQTFFSQSKLFNHKKTMHSKVYSCDKCSKVYTSHSGFMVHQLAHEEMLRFKCMLCKLAFSTMTKLDEHVKIKHVRNAENYL